jgi:hypothetical protein
MDNPSKRVSIKSHDDVDNHRKIQQTEKNIQIRKDKRFDKTLQHRRKVMIVY